MIFKTWGFIGLGHMGYPMARKLRANMPSSDKLLILELNRATMNQFIEETKEAASNIGNGSDSMKVEIAGNARELAERSSVIFTCLPSPNAVKHVFDYIFMSGKLPPMEYERLFIDSSTIDPRLSRDIAKMVQMASSGQFVDAPVSGGVVAARAGTLTFMYGVSCHSEELIERIESILSMMGNKIWHVGEQGSGLASKLANNYILAINNIATAEAMNMGLKWGLDLAILTKLINSSTGRCWPTEVNNPVPGVVKDSPASKGYEPGGTVGVIHKDLKLAMAGAIESGISLALAERASEVYEAVGKEYLDKDFSVVYQWLQDNVLRPPEVV